MAKKIINLTPHPITLANSNDEIVLTIPSSGSARLATTQKVVGEINGFSVNKTFYGQVEGLPDPIVDTIFVVSLLVAQQVSERDDVVAPDSGPSALREGGLIKAVRGFVRA